MQTISSAHTFISKFVFPIFWSLGFGCATVGLWLDAFHGRDGSPPEGWMKWQFTIMWLVGTGFLWWHCRRLKRVNLDDAMLYVSNYFTEIRIPLSDVSRVTETFWSGPKLVSVHLRTSSAFGRRIVFIPQWRWSWFESHPTVVLLNSLIPKPHEPH